MWLMAWVSLSDLNWREFKHSLHRRPLNNYKKACSTRLSWEMKSNRTSPIYSLFECSRVKVWPVIQQ